MSNQTRFIEIKNVVLEQSIWINPNNIRLFKIWYGSFKKDYKIIEKITIYFCCSDETQPFQPLTLESKFYDLELVLTRLNSF